LELIATNLPTLSHLDHINIKNNGLNIKKYSKEYEETLFKLRAKGMHANLLI